MKKQKPSKFGYPALLISSLLFGTNNYLFKIALASIPLPIFMAVRHLTAGLLMMPITLRNWQPMSIKTVARVAFVSFTTIAVANLIWAEGVKRSSLLAIGILGLMVPLFMYLFASILLRERVTKRVIYGSLIALIGSALLIVTPLSQDMPGTSDISGPILLMISYVLSALSTVLSKGTVKRVRPLQFTMLEMLFGSLPFVIYVIVTKQWQSMPPISTSSLIALVFLITTNGIGAFGLLNYGMKHCSTSRLVEQNYIQLFIGSLIAIIIAREQPTFGFILGSTLIGGGIWYTHAHIKHIVWHIYLRTPTIEIKRLLKKPELAIEYARRHVI